MSEQVTLTQKQARLLRLSARKGGMYDGDRWDFAPGGYSRLEAMGLVREEAPHNPVHKPRAVITEAGRIALAAWGGTTPMTADTQNPGGWPDASKPGYPANPERDGWHWLETGRGKALACYWHEQHWTTPVGDFALRPELVLDWRYLGPCFTPAEVASREAAARREGIEAAAAVASKRAASRHSTVAHCHSDRAKKHMQIRADEAGQLVADIRALLEDER